MSQWVFGAAAKGDRGKVDRADWTGRTVSSQHCPFSAHLVWAIEADFPPAIVLHSPGFLLTSLPAYHLFMCGKTIWNSGIVVQHKWNTQMYYEAPVTLKDATIHWFHYYWTFDMSRPFNLKKLSNNKCILKGAAPLCITKWNLCLTHH